MSVSLPDLLDPRKAVAQSARYEGVLELTRLPRLCDLLWQPAASSAEPWAVAYRFEFGRDEDARSVVTGHLETRLPLRCQRCGQRFDLPVDAKISLALVAGIDEANVLPECYEPLVVEDRLMRTSELIEDELILAVPAIPRHPDDLCEPPAVPVPPAPGRDEPKTGASPFAALAALRTRDQDDRDQD